MMRTEMAATAIPKRIKSALPALVSISGFLSYRSRSIRPALRMEGMNRSASTNNHTPTKTMHAKQTQKSDINFETGQSTQYTTLQHVLTNRCGYSIQHHNVLVIQPSKTTNRIFI